MKKYLAILAAFALAGCATLNNTPPPLVVTPQAPVVPPVVNPVVSKPVQWHVYDKKALQELLDKTKPDENIVLFGLDTDNFKALNENLVDIRRYIREKNAAYNFVLDATKPANPKPTK